ncbi:unnamed protein product [Rotaria magnacalcarata]|uniref:F-box domain-containing protein n=2 Tax=Rotaria magnacalcarata TaxID=392030 RepID=A0A816GHG7_9BILA|nr:unnamed protein product [Rotaria magnacalcarata]CAF1674738.1 unnamed protein product [Rotaria magnacalcarata]CAF4257171.1 unnamed protein product [Rotaria magnacalcarata]CAF4606267.1 unnamed protein product [Rotaria magnacalcarata]
MNRTDDLSIILPPCAMVFESLPDEIFFEIFEYVSIQDLYHGFYSLNLRFRMILASLTNLYGETTFERELYSPPFRFFASRITKFSMHHVDLMNLSPFSAVRSLTLYIEPNRAQCQVIRAFSHLKYLYISQRPIGHFYYSVSLPHFVFTNAYPNLYTCQLNLISYRIQQNWTCVPSLHTLSVCLENPRVFARILQSCPSLIRLKVELTQHFTRPTTRFDIAPHICLRRFHLYLNQTMFSCCDIIEVLLSLVPNLTDFGIRGTASTAYSLNINLLADVLHRCVPKLQHFHLDMFIEESLSRMITDSANQQIGQLFRLFTNIQIYPSTQKVPARLIIQG